MRVPFRSFGPFGATCWVVAFSVILGGQSFAQQAPAPPPQTPPAPSAPPIFSTNITVVAPTPVPGIEQPVGQIPSAVQTATSRDLEQLGALDLSDLLNKRLTSVHINEVQGNPLQADVNYRGYTASPLLGTPQGLSVYMDGVRLNQPFGDVVSWDLIPKVAIGSITMMPGSNPLFGLNTLGGALSLQTKDGRRNRGTSVEASYASFTRRALEFEHGGGRDQGLAWYLAGNAFDEHGWRAASPSRVGQLFGKLSWRSERTDLNGTVAYADNSLNGNGLQEQRLLALDRASVYTKPDTTNNRATLVNLTGLRRLRDTVIASGNVYVRRLHTDTLNADINEGALDQPVYQPGAAERAALAAAGYTDVPASGATAANTPFPFWRCLGSILIKDEPGEKCNALINRSDSHQTNGGISGELTFLRTSSARQNRLIVGAAYDHSDTKFSQSTELGYLNGDRSVTGTGAFADGVSAGNVDGEPFDSRVGLNSRSQTTSVFAANTLTWRQRTHVTLSARYNDTRVHNRDQIQPGGGADSLDGDHTFRRLNPAAGLAVDLRPNLNVYVGYSEASRAATSIELGCANPDRPCKLPNAIAGDPPLDQVVARTIEGGLRGGTRLQWNVGVFRSQNDDDILFVTAEQTGFGYFKNFGQTRRQGLELGTTDHLGKVTFGAGYTYLDATYQTAETVGGTGNSTNDAALDGIKGAEGSIEIAPGDRIPMVPRHFFKVFGDVPLGAKLSLDLDLVASSGTYARGNENNEHTPDGVYYLGPGRTDAYAVVNLGARYQPAKRVEVRLQINNLLGTEYQTAAQLGPTGLTGAGSFIARPFPAVRGVFPVQQATFFAPGAPRSTSLALRVRF